MQPGRAPVTILDCLDDPAIFGGVFTPRDSWAAWRAALAAIFGLPMTPEELAGYQACTGRTVAPTTQAREAWIIAGRRAGKSRVAAAIAVYLACFRDYSAVLAAGEVGTLMVLAADRRQARTLFRYIKGLLELPLLAGLMVGKPKLDRIVLRNLVETRIITPSSNVTNSSIGSVCSLGERASSMLLLHRLICRVLERLFQSSNSIDPLQPYSRRL